MATKSANKAVVGSKVYSNPRKEVSGNETRDSINLAIDESVNQDEYNANEAARDAEIAALSSSLGDYIPIAQKGVAEGVASLDENGKLPVAQLPSSIGSHNGLDGKQGGTADQFYHISQPLFGALSNLAPKSIIGNSGTTFKEAFEIQLHDWFFQMIVSPTLEQTKTFLGIENTEFDNLVYNVSLNGIYAPLVTKRYTTLGLNFINPDGGRRRINMPTFGYGNMCYLTIYMSEVTASDSELYLYSNASATTPILTLKIPETGKVFHYRAVLMHSGGWFIFGEKPSNIRGDATLDPLEARNVFSRHQTAQGIYKIAAYVPIKSKIKSISIYGATSNIQIDSFKAGYNDGTDDIVPEIIGGTTDHLDASCPLVWDGGYVYIAYGITYLDIPTGLDKMNIIIEYVENFKL